MKTNSWSWVWFFALLATNMWAINCLDSGLATLVQHKIQTPAQLSGLSLNFYSFTENRSVSFSLFPLFTFIIVGLGSCIRNIVVLKQKHIKLVVTRLVLFCLISFGVYHLTALWFSWSNPLNISDPEFVAIYIKYLTVKIDYLRGPEVTYSLVSQVIWSSIALLFMSAPSFKRVSDRSRFST